MARDDENTPPAWIRKQVLATPPHNTKPCARLDYPLTPLSNVRPNKIAAFFDCTNRSPPRSPVEQEDGSDKDKCTPRGRSPRTPDNPFRTPSKTPRIPVKRARTLSPSPAPLGRLSDDLPLTPRSRRIKPTTFKPLMQVGYNPQHRVNRLLNRELGLSKTARAFSLRSYVMDFVSTDKNVYLMTQEDGHQLYEIPPFSCTYSHSAREGKLLAVADEGGMISLLDTRRDNTLELERGRETIQAHRNCVFDVRWRKDDRVLLAASGDHSATLWDVEYKKCTGIFAGHNCTVRSAAFGWDDIHIVITGSRDGHIMVWDTRCQGTVLSNGTSSHKPVDVIRGAHESLTAAQRRKKQSKKELTQGQESVTAVLSLEHTSNLIASAGAADGSIKYWDVRSHRSHKGKHKAIPSMQSIYDGPSSRPRGLSWLTLDSTGSRIFALSKDNSIYMHDAFTLGKPIGRFTSATKRLFNTFYVRCAISPDDRFIVSGSNSKDVCLWEIDHKPPQSSDPFYHNLRSTSKHQYYTNNSPVYLKAHTQEVTAVAWCSADITQLASCSDDHTVRVWNIDSHLASQVREDAKSKNEDSGGMYGMAVDEPLEPMQLGDGHFRDTV
ncbi:hypothetical protein BZG36_03893 [Bifiguratus adelaidae]|uniref:Anaphase-promoting complex subunit 4 WD40 domain-containing protein n=1 Tax=Bifiguratus adelaidae TaxID=1938954 RepID=A0A261XXV1_9FUNG|nr:hypothetical protein BZG36_03893 [Bifiguratus adelaidae]